MPEDIDRWLQQARSGGLATATPPSAGRADSDVGEFGSFNPRYVLIARTANSLDTDEARSFELFRNALSDVEIWTFDEVAARLLGIRAALAAPTAGAAVPAHS